MNPEWQTSVDEFRGAAGRFIQAVDSRDDLNCEQFLKRIEIRMTELHVSALRLPIVVPETDGDDAQTFSKDAWAELWGQLREKLSKNDHYWSVFDATAQDPPIDGSPAADVVWEIRFSFTSHWGRHLTSALKAIFDLQLNWTLG
jgi:hypothetical protein